MPTLGLVVNPIAGMGGRVALRGTDGPETLREARARGAVPLAGERARRALRGSPRGRACWPRPGRDGRRTSPRPRAESRRRRGARVVATRRAAGAETTAADTWAAAAEMRALGVDLLLFAGGDGTARDIHDAIGADLPLVGMPTGVKMHSGVFAATPDAAGRGRGRVPARRPTKSARGHRRRRRGRGAGGPGRDAALRRGAGSEAPRHILCAKAPSPAADAGLQALCEALRRLPGVTLLGPGTTTARIRKGTLLGVDALEDGELIATDLDERAAAASSPPTG